MKKYYLNSLKLILTFFVLFIVCFSLLLSNTSLVHAIRSLGVGYFTNKSYSGLGNKVLRGGDGSSDDGIPSWVNTKAEFITFIVGKHNNGNNNDKIGADYIIQTMRGEDLAGNFDYSRPSASDIADWKSKINNPSVRW